MSDIADSRPELFERATAVRRGKRLEYFTIVWNMLEGLAAVAAGVMAGSISLVGFGFDSFIEVTSGAAVLWRMHSDADACRRERVERTSLRIVGICFLVLAAYILYDSILSLIRKEAAEESLFGIGVAIASLIAMPILSRAKRKVGRELSSGAMAADARQTEFCTYLSVILLAGLGLNALFGWWWADPVAAIVMIPIIAREGLLALRGHHCACAGE